MKNLKLLLQRVLMFGKIITFVFDPKWNSLINSVPAMKQACDLFKSMVESINANISRYHSITRGIAGRKHAIRVDLNEISYSIVASVRSWAIKNSDVPLAANLEVSYAGMKNMTYKNFMPFIQNAISMIEPHVAALAQYNVTPETFALWQEKFQAMQNILNGPQSAIKERKTLGNVIVNDVKKAMDFLDNQLTPLVSNFQNTPEFFIGFYNNKKIGLPNVHHTRLIAHVVSEIGAPCYAAIVTVDEYTDPQTGKTYPAESSITNPEGNCEVSGFFPGFRTITVSGKDIKPTTTPPIEFQSGKAITLEITVAPAFNIPAPAPEAKQKAAAK